VWWGGNGGEDEGKEEDEICNFHSTQLRFLEIKPLRDFLILHNSNAT